MRNRPMRLQRPRRRPRLQVRRRQGLRRQPQRRNRPRKILERSGMSDLGTNFREEFTETPLLKKGVSKFNIAAIVGIPLAAILFQVYVPRFFERLSYLEL